MAPVTFPRKKMVIGPGGEGVLVQKTDAELRKDRFRELRINGPAYACFAAATVSFGWTLILVAWGAWSFVRLRMQHTHHDNID